MRKSIIYIFIVGILFSLSACDKWLDVNQNPNAPDKVEGYLLTAPIFQQMAQAIQWDARFTGRYVQYWSHNSASTTWETHGYDQGSDNGGQMWRHVYWTGGQNISMMINDSKEKQKWDFLGLAYTLRAWGWQELTDLHGPIIYKEAFDPKLSTFNYDNQDTIYRAVRGLCQSALNNYARTDGAATSLQRGDLIYGGDKSKWVKFTYGVLARNYNSLINKTSGEFKYDPDKVIEYVDKSLASNADNALVPYTGASTLDANFFGGMRYNLSAYKQTTYMLSLLDGTVFGTADPRFTRLMMVSPDGTYRGVVPTYGDPNNTTGNVRRMPTVLGLLVGNAKDPGRYIFSDKAPMPIMTYAELQFIKAEAAFIKGDKAMALTAYKNGITASLDFVSQYSAANPGNPDFVGGNKGSAITTAEKTAFLGNTSIVPTDPNALTISMIMQQKYLALWGYGFNQTWVDMRKYHYDTNIYKNWKVETIRLFSYNSGKYAYRIRPRYNSEYVWNLETITKYGGDKQNYHTKELWFSNDKAVDDDDVVTTW